MLRVCRADVPAHDCADCTSDKLTPNCVPDGDPNNGQPHNKSNRESDTKPHADPDSRTNYRQPHIKSDPSPDKEVLLRHRRYRW